MKKISIITIAFYVIFTILTFVANSLSLENDYINNMKRDLLVLMMAYPNSIKTVEKGKDGLVYLVMSNDKRILYDNKIEKDSNSRLYNSDLQDTLFEDYPLDKIDSIMDTDPGRTRCYEFLKAMYGRDRNEIEKNLVYVPTHYGNIMFSKANEASIKIKEVLNEVGELVEREPKVGSYVTPLSGTYNYRLIQDTGQLSPHAFGIAIDLKRDDADYWKWGKADLAKKRITNYPKELVDIFQEHGFVWGGKWKHFDILHFEYRPEIILKAKYFNNYPLNECTNWYEGAEENDNTKALIELIDNIVDN